MQGHEEKEGNKKRDQRNQTIRVKAYTLILWDTSAIYTEVGRPFCLAQKMSRSRLFPTNRTNTSPRNHRIRSPLTLSFGFCFTGILGRGATFFCLLCSGPKGFKRDFVQMPAITAFRWMACGERGMQTISRPQREKHGNIKTKQKTKTWQHS